jgi:hypothetical protein
MVIMKANVKMAKRMDVEKPLVQISMRANFPTAILMVMAFTLGLMKHALKGNFKKESPKSRIPVVTWLIPVFVAPIMENVGAVKHQVVVRQGE